MNRIFVLENEQTWQEIITEYLNALGYETTTASTLGDSHINILHAPERYQLLILDINLTDHQDRQGLMLLDLLSSQGIFIPTVVLSGYLTIDLLKTFINEYDQQVIAALEKGDFVQNPAKVRCAIERGIASPRNKNTQSAYSPHNATGRNLSATDNEFRIQLYEQINNTFSDEELRTLTWFLVVEYDDLSGNGRAAKTRELIGFMQRHGRLDEFVNALRRLRPHIDWSDSK